MGTGVLFATKKHCNVIVVMAQTPHTDQNWILNLEKKFFLL